MTYLITGATGFIGQKLVTNLLEKKARIIVLTRDKSKANQIFGTKVKAIEKLNKIKSSENIEHIINLAGAGIASKKWSGKQKEILVSSRVETTQNIVRLIKRLKNKPQTFISASAIGYYGSNLESRQIDERGAKNEQFTSQLCQKWEKAALEVSGHVERICLPRIGIVLGKNGGALKRMLPAFKFGLGGKIGSGEQFMSWIHLDDVISGFNFLIEKKLNGIFNFTSPNPVTNLEFSQKLGQSLNRPTFLPMPEFAVKILFGQMGEELLLNGRNIYPQNLTKNAFDFKFRDLGLALSQL